MALLAPRALSVLYIALHELHAWNALTHTFDKNCTLVYLCFFFSAFLRRFRPENGVKSPNCRFFRGRKPDFVSFQFSLSLAFLLEILTSGLYTLES